MDIVHSDAAPETEIKGVTLDSRAVQPDFLFAAIPGYKSDGHDFIPAAVDAGAVAVLTERWLDTLDVAQVQVTDVRRALARAAANYYQHPSQQLQLVGITGTNGKTTTSFMLHSILAVTGRKATLVGGVEYRIAGETAPAVRTTPEAMELQGMLARAVDAGDAYAVVEVSSHGIELFRAAFVDFAVAVFTNLTREHLDLHKDMESYYQVKRRLFLGTIAGDNTMTAKLPLAVINTDNEYGERLVRETEEAGGKVFTFGAASDADITAEQIVYSGWKTSFILLTPDGSAPVELAIPGSFSLANALAAAAAASAMGLSVSEIATGLNGHRGAPGRFEAVDAGTPYKVVIDYAHNEDGLARAIETARGLTPGKLILVFGCPGERDRDKRPHMGRLAGSSTDLAILTTDDCYDEAPDQILDGAEAGLVEAGGIYRRISDRRDAIAAALAAAGAGDTVLIAGKGHETKQVLAGGPVPFNDRQVVEDLIASL
jgi:UDP-N-acetylmuramoyl-L-alanyl-D-glutamate--2,6-diaminopimelate ligase